MLTLNFYKVKQHNLISVLGLSTLLYLSDENRNLLAVQINSDLKLLAIEDIVIPSTLISATNLQWRPEFRSCIPTFFAGERSAFSSNPKESHLQGAFHELRNVVKVKPYTEFK